jgi:hypothetical protein
MRMCLTLHDGAPACGCCYAAVRYRACCRAAARPVGLARPTASHSVGNKLTCLTLVNRPWPISRPPDATSTEPSGYTCTLAAMAGGEQSNLRAQKRDYTVT